MSLDTASREWLLTCLARWICDKPTLEERSEFMAAWRARHGAESARILGEYVRTEWKKKRN